MSIAARRLMRVRRTTPVIPPGVYTPKIGWVDDGPYAASGGNGSRTRDPEDIKYKWAYTTADVKHTVLNVGMSELINVTSTGVTTYKASDPLGSMLSKITAWNAAHPSDMITAHIRLHVGRRAPEMWRTIFGSVYMTDSNFGQDGDIPIWWEDSSGNNKYLTLYTNAMNALAPVINANPLIGSVNAPGGAMFYPEPILYFPSSKGKKPGTQNETNLQRLTPLGFTASKHQRWLNQFVTRHTAFTKIVELAINPNSNLYPTMVNNFINSLSSGQACIANYSYSQRRSTIETGYMNMYEWLDTNIVASRKAWVGVQLARPGKVAIDETNQVWDTLGQAVINRKWHFVETTGPKDPSAGPNAANVWPSDYEDEPLKMKNQSAAFATNPHP